jgi:hypothetical protein
MPGLDPRIHAPKPLHGLPVKPGNDKDARGRIALSSGYHRSPGPVGG